MSTRNRNLFILMMWMTILSTACDAIQLIPPTETFAPELINTYAAQTMAANPDLALLLNSPTPAPATNTPVPTYTATLIPTLTSIPSATPLPTLTPESFLQEGDEEKIKPGESDVLIDSPDVPCNAAEFIRDVTVPDDMSVSPGERFTKVWELQNVGSCTWTEEYSLVLVWGNPMGTEPPLPLRRVVKPGELVEISINMVAPIFPACFQGNWMLQDDKGNQFGTGFKYKEAIWVSVSVEIPGLSFLSKG